MDLHEIDALLADTSHRLGLDPSPVTPESIPAEPVASTVAARGKARGTQDRPKKDADRYMGDVRSYLGKVRRGRSVRTVDPAQPAFSPDAEMIRQTNAVDKANRHGTRRPR